jgi:hypothetical protein
VTTKLAPAGSAEQDTVASRIYPAGPKNFGPISSSGYAAFDESTGIINFDGQKTGTRAISVAKNVAIWFPLPKDYKIRQTAGILPTPISPQPPVGLPGDWVAKIFEVGAELASFDIGSKYSLSAIVSPQFTSSEGNLCRLANVTVEGYTKLPQTILACHAPNQRWEDASLFRMDAPQPEPAVTVVGDVLVYDGEIGAQFTDILKGHAFTKLSINSPGGIITQALEGGAWLRENGKAVEARDSCLSACVFILAGGTERHETVNARVGVRRFSALTETGSKTATESPQEMADRSLRYLENMGISSELWHAMEQGSFDDVRYLDVSTLLAWKVLTPETPLAGANAFVIAVGQDAVGYDLSRSGIHVTDVDACEQSCRDNAACRAFTFDTLNNFCFLKKGVDVVVFDPRAVMGYRKSGDMTPRPAVGLIRHVYTKLLGTPYKTLENLDSGECMALCLKDFNCKGYNFETTNTPFTARQKNCSLLAQIEGTSIDKNVSSGQPEPRR